MSDLTLSARDAARREDGFTLIELLASMFCLLLFMGAFSVVFASTVHHNGEVQEQSLLQSEARTAIDRFAGELRQAYVGDGTSPVTSVAPTTITFYSPDRVTPFHLLQISYRVTGGHLDRAFATSTNTSTTGPPWTMPALGAWSTELTSIANSTVFTYLDTNGNVTANPASVHTVTITLTVATLASASRQFTFSTSATLRSSG